jgi:hypothetical protein
MKGSLMVLNRNLFFLIAAAVCFIVALLLSLSVFKGSNEAAWAFGGALAFVLAHIP